MNERELSNLFSGFWQQALPNLETVTRAFNLGPEREDRPLKSAISPGRRDIVSETAFRLVGISLSGAPLSVEEGHAHAFSAASDFLRTTRESDSREAAPLSVDERSEVEQLAARMRVFLRRPQGITTFMPKFAGHGALEACFGDFSISASTLVEIKCVDRSFRSTDYRQMLTYAALLYYSESVTFDTLSLYNPLRGTSVTIRTDELIYSSSGKVPEEFFHELSYLLASGQLSR